MGVAFVCFYFVAEFQKFNVFSPCDQILILTLKNKTFNFLKQKEE